MNFIEEEGELLAQAYRPAERGALVLGCDTGLAHFGWAVARVLPVGFEPLGMGTIATEKDDAKGRTLAACDNFRRARQVANTLAAVLDTFSGHGEVRLVCYEALSLPRNAGVSAQIGMGFGVLATISSSVALDAPALEVSPMKLKKASTGSGTASKVDVGRAVAASFGLPLEQRGRSTKAPPWTPMMGDRLARDSGDREHAWDALGAILACADSDLMRAIRPRG